MQKKIILTLLLTALLALPFLSSAVNFIEPPLKNQDYSQSVTLIINRLFTFIIWPIVVTVVIVLFIMAGFSFLTSAGDPAKLENARRFLAWAVIGTVIILISFSAIETLKAILQIQ